MNPKYTQEEFEKAKTRDKLPLICENCNNVFLMKKCNIIRALSSNNGGKFCSFKCIGENKTKNKNIIVKCLTCNNNITITQSNYDRSKYKHFFCSDECELTYKKIAQNTITLCSFCNQEIKVKKSRANKSKSGKLFCSHECSSKYNAQFIEKEKSIHLDVACSNCGKIKRIRQYTFNNCKSKKFFCNYDCSKQYKRQYNYNKGKCTKIPKECCICGKIKMIHQNLIDRNKTDNVICSKECQAKYSSIINSGEKITVNCMHCGKQFEKLKTIVEKQLNHFCTKKCSNLYRIKKIKTKCHNCQKDILVKNDKYNNSINKRFFCNKECCHSWMSLHGDKVSLMEKYLRNKITLEYPNMTVEYNVRNLLGFYYEFDLYFPSIKLLVEVNGAGHYLPIYGKDKEKVLKNIQRKDQLKVEFCNKNNFALLVINTSKAKRDFTVKNTKNDYLWLPYWHILKEAIDKAITSHL